MRYIYNGVDLMPVETYALDFSPVYDPSGIDYLYTKVELICRAVVNGLVTVAIGPPISYAMSNTPANQGARTALYRLAPNFVPPVNNAGIVTPGIGVNVPAGAVGTGGMSFEPLQPLRTITITPNPAVETHAAIRHRLSTPRGILFVFVGPGQEFGPVIPNFTGRLLLQSPDDDSDWDCKYGPFPKILGVHTALGDGNTLLVDWSCETYINERVENSSPSIDPTALLSHRFSQVHSVPQDGYTTITNNGLAIFRADFLANLGQTPDVHRPFLFMPLEQGFVREIDHVRGREDVTGVEYQYRDIQQYVNFVAGPYVQASNISVVHRQAIVSNVDLLGIPSAGLDAYKEILNIKAAKELGRSHREEREMAAKEKAKIAKKFARLGRASIKPPPPGPR